MAPIEMSDKKKLTLSSSGSPTFTKNPSEQNIAMHSLRELWASMVQFIWKEKRADLKLGNRFKMNDNSIFCPYAVKSMSIQGSSLTA